MTIVQQKRHSSVSSSLSSNAAVTVTEWRSIYFVAAICIMEGIKISVVQVNSWPYLKSIDPSVGEEFYGVSKSAYTLGQMVCSVLAGWVSNRLAHTKPSILFGTLVTMLCCLIYANMEVFQEGHRKWSFLILEIFLGWGGGATTMWRTHLAMASTDRDRKTATAVISIAINLGFIVGPLLVLLWGYLLARAMPLPWGAHLSIYTAPVYVQAGICAAGVAMLALFFDGKMRGGAENDWANGGGTCPEGTKWAQEGRGRNNNKKKQSMDGTMERAPLEELAVSVGREEVSSPMPPPSPSKIAKSGGAESIWPFDYLAIFACFLVRINFSSFILYLIALSAPFAMTTFGWSGEQTVIYMMLTQGSMGIMGVLISVGYAMRILSRIKERHCILISLVLMLIFFVTSFPWPFLTAEIPHPRYHEEIVNGTVTRKLVANGCDRNMYNWCDSTPATNVYVYHVALILCLGFAMPIGQVNMDTLYSRLLGPIRQGTMQGLFFAVGEILPLFGPPIANYTYQYFGPRPFWLSQILLFSLSIILWILCYHRLVPGGTVVSESHRFAATPVTKLIVNPENGVIVAKSGTLSANSKKRQGLLHTD